MKKIFLTFWLLLTAGSLFGAGEHYIPFLDGNKLGYMDSTGKIMIEPRYKFKEPALEIKIDKVKYSIPRFTNAHYFSEDRVMVNLRKYILWFIPLNEKYAVINPENRILQDSLRYPISSFSEGFATTYPFKNLINDDTDPEYIYITYDLVQAFPGEFENAGKFSEGLAAVVLKDENKFFYVDKTGKNFFNKSFEFCDDFSEGLAFVETAEKTGYINKTGEFEFTGSFEKGFHFSSGIAVTYSDGVFGFIDKSGNYISNKRWLKADDFSCERALVGMNDLFGYIDKSGNEVIPVQYKQAKSFSQGLAAVYSSGGLWGYIDTEGNEVLKADYVYAGNFKNGVAMVVNWKKEVLYINREGKVIYNFGKAKSNDK